MTLPVPLSTFRANLPHYIALLQEGTQIMVTKHGRDVALVTKPEDAAGVEDPPGEELMERLLSGEGEPGWSIPPTATFTDADGNPVSEVDIAPTDTIRLTYPDCPDVGLYRPSPTEVHRVVDGVDVGPVVFGLPKMEADAALNPPAPKPVRLHAGQTWRHPDGGETCIAYLGPGGGVGLYGFGGFTMDIGPDWTVINARGSVLIAGPGFTG